MGTSSPDASGTKEMKLSSAQKSQPISNLNSVEILSSARNGSSDSNIDASAATTNGSSAGNSNVSTAIAEYNSIKSRQGRQGVVRNAGFRPITYGQGEEDSSSLQGSCDSGPCVDGEASDDGPCADKGSGDGDCFAGGPDRKIGTVDRKKLRLLGKPSTNLLVCSAGRKADNAEVRQNSDLQAGFDEDRQNSDVLAGFFLPIGRWNYFSYTAYKFAYFMKYQASGSEDLTICDHLECRYVLNFDDPKVPDAIATSRTVLELQDTARGLLQTCDILKEMILHKILRRSSDSNFDPDSEMCRLITVKEHIIFHKLVIYLILNESLRRFCDR